MMGLATMQDNSSQALCKGSVRRPLRHSTFLQGKDLPFGMLCLQGNNILQGMGLRLPLWGSNILQGIGLPFGMMRLQGNNIQVSYKELVSRPLRGNNSLPYRGMTFGMMRLVG